MAWQTASSEFELLVWMRGAYRNLGIAGACLETPLKEIWAFLTELQREGGGVRDFTLRVRYLDGLVPGSGSRLERAMWLSFFYDRDFRKRQVPPEEQGADLILERSYSAWLRRQQEE